MIDPIERQDAIKAFKDFLTIHDSRGAEYLCPAVTMDGVNKILSNVPPAQPERKKGKWIHGKEIAREYLGNELIHLEYENFHCSECGYTVKNIRWNINGELVDRYCSFCGADMRGTE